MENFHNTIFSMALESFPDSCKSLKLHTNQSSFSLNLLSGSMYETPRTKEKNTRDQFQLLANFLLQCLGRSNNKQKYIINKQHYTNTNTAAPAKVVSELIGDFQIPYQSTVHACKCWQSPLSWRCLLVFRSSGSFQWSSQRWGCNMVSNFKISCRSEIRIKSSKLKLLHFLMMWQWRKYPGFLSSRARL